MVLFCILRPIKYITMKKEEKNRDKENQSQKEQAVNKSATQGKEINHQVEQKREKHQPRDTA